MSLETSISSEDVFDADADEMSVQNNEWKHNIEKRVKDGYVEGIVAGKEASRQVGFNLGYPEGATKTVALGRLKGIVSAVHCWCQQCHHPNSSASASVASLLQRIIQHEDRLMEMLRQSMKEPPASVGNLTDMLEQLEVRMKEAGRGGGEGGGEGGECNKTGCCQKGEGGSNCSNPSCSCCSGTTSGIFNLGESLNELLQSCIELFVELGLPQELIEHLQTLKSVE